MTPAEHAALQEALANFPTLPWSVELVGTQVADLALAHLLGILTEIEALKADRDRLLAENARLRDGQRVTLETLQAFLDTFGDLGDRVTQADINDRWAELEGAKT